MFSNLCTPLCWSRVKSDFLDAKLPGTTLMREDLKVWASQPHIAEPSLRPDSASSCCA